MESAERIAGMEVQRLALESATELETLYVGRRSYRADDNDCGLWITEDGKIIALLVWRRWEEEGCAWIGMGWTSREHRRKGLYKALVVRLMQIARAVGLHKIGCAIDPRNLDSLAAHRALGLVTPENEAISLEVSLDSVSK